MSRNALARTYRPRRFDEMATQEHVSSTLRSAVSRDRVAHAYLFSGPRGVGKTTAARVLAMALNCPNRGEDGEPCGTCESCTRIWAGRTSLDVVEIDAASNRGVDDARDLRERAMYAPTEEGRFKVYIIDEAHMLTREAWNALLKILEEPPPRVIFVFATTEPQKIQQTAPPILSRCQRFDFRRISVADIVARLAEVLAEEGVETDEQALLLLARRAEGGMRDALSLLDQALSFVEGRLGVPEVQRILGLVADEVYLDLFRIIAEGRVADVFRFVQEIVEGGHDLSEFYRGLTDALRTLLVLRFDGADAAEVREDLRAVWTERADAFSTGDLLRMLSAVAELDADGRFRKSANPRVLLEALLLRFAHLPRTVEVEALIRATGAPEPVAGSTAAGAVARGKAAAATQLPVTSETAGMSGPPTAARTTASPPQPQRSSASSPAASTGAADVGTVGEGPSAAGSAAAGSAPAGSAAAGSVPAGAAPAASAAAGPRPSAEQALRQVAESASGKLPSGLGLFLRSAHATEEDGHVVVEVAPGPGLEMLEEDPGARKSLEKAMCERLGRTVDVRIRAAGEAAVAPRLTPERLREEQVRRLTSEEPAVERAVREWDLEMLD